MSKSEGGCNLDDRLYDLLVDGELLPDQRRDLLNQLDLQPDGWRRCALAFLEAQSFRAALGPLAAQRKEATATPASAGRERRTRGGFSRMPWVGLAAGLLVAFTLGLATGRNLPAQRGPLHEVAKQNSKNVSQPLVSESSSREKVASNDSDRADGDAALDELVATLSFDLGDGSAQTEVEVPVVERQDIDEAWLEQQPSAMPPYVQQRLERLGYQVQQQRTFLPFSLEDGRQLVVPVDAVNVSFVGHQRY